MRFATITAALASASLTSAKIIGMTAPAAIKAGEPYQITLKTNGEPAEEISVTYGYTSARGGNEDYEIGQFSKTELLGKSNVNEDFTIDAVAPAELANWTPATVLTVAVHQTVGKTATSVVNGYIVGFNVANKTSERQVISKDGIGWKQDNTCKFKW